VARILACGRAGAYVELVGGMTGGEPRGRDLQRIGEWREAVLPIYGPDGWTRLYAASFAGLQSWYRYQSVQLVFRELAPAIAQQATVSRYQLLSMLEMAGAGQTPEPRFEAVLAPARRKQTLIVPGKSRSKAGRVGAESAMAQTQEGEETAYEDSTYRYYMVDDQGKLMLSRRIKKTTGAVSFVVIHVVGEDKAGKPIVRGGEFLTEAAARREMEKMAAA